MIHEFLDQLAADPLALLGRWFALAPALAMLLFAAAAVVARNLVRAALCLTVSFIALGVLFIALGAEFVGFVQLLVYVGAVAMLIVFAILLTRPERLAKAPSPFLSAGPLAGIAISFAALLALLAFIFSSPLAAGARQPAVSPSAPVAKIGEALMGGHIPALIAVGILLTAALVGAAVIAMEDQ